MKRKPLREPFDDFCLDFLDGIHRDPACNWCKDPGKPIDRSGLCRHCYRISLEVRRARAMMGRLSQFPQKSPQRIPLELEISNRLQMEQLCRNEGESYGDLHTKDLDGLSLEYDLQLLSQWLLGKRLFRGWASILDHAFSLHQRRFLSYTLSKLIREFSRRHRKSIAMGQVMLKEIHGGLPRVD
jgi:hypothetical protein